MHIGVTVKTGISVHSTLPIVEDGGESGIRDARTGGTQRFHT